MSKKKSEKTDKADIAMQNVDTNVSVINTDDPRSFEQKNIPKGAFKKNQGSK